MAETPKIAETTQADITFEEFTLANGLRVIVHTDRKAPIVAVNVWYHVGSKDEPAGRSGFAHLFEHLMFQGSENYRDEFFGPFELVGATDQNGTTNTDRTNYFQNVPTTALDMALWMESDRMGHLVGAIDQKLLDEQRGVVLYEKREGENQPYGLVWDELGRATYPQNHPYHRGVIGSMADLNAASLADVKQWFRAWYGPNNAVLVLAGDIDVATAKQKVTRYFGDIPPGPTLAQPPVDVAQRASTSRAEMQDMVPQARVHRAWNVAAYGDPDFEQLQLFAQVLGGSKSSRLGARLVHRDQSADSVSAGAYAAQLGSQFLITADVKAGGDIGKIEAAIDAELDRLLTQGPTALEVEQARTVLKAGFVRGIERIGGFGGKADALAECTVFTGNPGCFRDSLATLEAATPASVQAAGRKWLAAGDHTLTVVPGTRGPITEEPAVEAAPLTLPAADPKYTVVASDVDRSKGVPKVTDFPALKFPALQRATLANGIEVILAERHDIPVVQFSLELDGGFASDDSAKLGAASFAMSMLDEGAGDYDALGFANRAEQLGASVAAGASLDGGSVYLSALKEKLDPSLALLATMLRDPAFKQTEIDRVRGQWLAGIAQEKARPQGMALRALPPLLYGASHPYGIPFSGTGTEDSIKALTRDDLLAYHRNWVRPQGATLLVVGDTTLAEIKPLLEQHLGNWNGVGAAPATASIAAVPLPTKPRVFLIDQPGAQQSTIIAGLLMPSTKDASALRLFFANAVLGGEFTSRLNMNLRENKHWSYGSYSGMQNALAQRPWLAFAAVQTDKTAESQAEVMREIREYASGKRPASIAEIDKIRATEIRGLPGSFETGRAVLGTLGGIVRYDRPDDYVVRRAAEIEAMTAAQVTEAAATINPDALTWVVVGDLSKIEAPLRAANIGELKVLDADGKVVR
ncbi:MAG: pitrilysin family protein [Lysobacterales bacterium]